MNSDIEPVLPEIRLDKTKIRVVDGTDDSDEIEYWRHTSIKERLQQLERLRRTFYGARARARLQRVIEVVQSAQS